MADDEISVQDFNEGTPTTVDAAKNVDTKSMTGVGGKTVHRQVVCLGDETTFGNVANVNSSGQLEVAVGNTVTVTATDLDVRDLSSASDSVAVTDGGGSVTIDNSNLDAAISTRATEATLALIKAKTDNLDVALSDLTTPADTQPVSGTVTANAGTNLNTSALALETTATSIKTAVEIIDNAIAGTEMQVDIVTMPAVTVSGTVATDPTDDATRDNGKIDVASLDQYTPIDIDSGAGTVNALPITWRKSSALGVEFGTATDPVRTDPTGSTTQPVSAASLPLPSGAATSANQSTEITSLQLIDDAIYNEAATDTTITGIPILWEDAADTLRPVSLGKPLPAFVTNTPATLLTDGGGTEANVLRVTIANDSTGLLSVDDNGSSLTVDGTVSVNLNAGTNTNEVVGDVAHSAAVAGNPVRISGAAQTMDDTAPPNRVDAEGDATTIATDLDGAVFAHPHGPQIWSYHENSSSALTDASVHAATGDATLTLYVTDIVVSTGAATAFNIFFEEATTTVLGPFYLEATAGRGFSIHLQTPKKLTANTALTVTTSAAIAHSIEVTGYVGKA